MHCAKVRLGSAQAARKRSASFSTLFRNSLAGLPNCTTLSNLEMSLCKRPVVDVRGTPLSFFLETPNPTFFLDCITYLRRQATPQQSRMSTPKRGPWVSPGHRGPPLARGSGRVNLLGPARKGRKRLLQQGLRLARVGALRARRARRAVTTSEPPRKPLPNSLKSLSQFELGRKTSPIH